MPDDTTTGPPPRRVEAVRAALADEHHEAPSGDRTVRAGVDGTGRLRAVRIDRTARHDGRPERLGAAIVDAVAAARARTTPRARELLGAALRGRAPAAVALAVPPAAHPGPAPDRHDDADLTPASWLVEHRPGREHRR